MKLEKLDTSTSDRNQYFYGRGNLLLTGEYFVLDGAKSMALPTSFGQSLCIQYASSLNPKLFWRSFDHQGTIWLEVQFELYDFHILNDHKPNNKKRLLQRILREVRKQNTRFLKDETDVFAETCPEFPLYWGLGSSATLISIVAQWASISAIELFFNVFEGSGYDVACAQSQNPILYQKLSSHSQWDSLLFSPPFKESMYFVYLGRKKDTREALAYYHSKGPFPTSIMETVSTLTENITKAKSLEDFQWLLEEHEDIVAKNLQLPKTKDCYFCDFPGTIKSLGAWGGDFVLAVTSELDSFAITRYFKEKGMTICLPYNKMTSYAG